MEGYISSVLAIFLFSLLDICSPGSHFHGFNNTPNQIQALEEILAMASTGNHFFFIIFEIIKVNLMNAIFTNMFASVPE